MVLTKDYCSLMLQRQNNGHEWDTDLLHTVGADPTYYCFATACAPCSSYMLRKRALSDDMSSYVCCGGYKSCSGRCGESRCPEFCLATEVVCCFSTSVVTTRFMLLDEFGIGTTQCDDLIFGCIFCLHQLGSIFHFAGRILGSEHLKHLSHVMAVISEIIYCSVCACMQTQHKLEMDKRDSMLFGFSHQPTVVPEIQQMSRLDQPYPPVVGYPVPYPSPVAPTTPATVADSPPVAAKTPPTSPPRTVANNQPAASAKTPPASPPRTVVNNPPAASAKTPPASPPRTGANTPPAAAKTPPVSPPRTVANTPPAALAKTPPASPPRTVVNDPPTNATTPPAVASISRG